MSEFVYLYRGSDRSGAPQERQQTMQKWGVWMKELGEKGHIKDQGNPLGLTGKVVKDRKGTVSDGPYAEAKDVVGGYTLIEAKDMAQAVQLAAGCPIFDMGGFVEVRPVMNMGM
jgi:hypothetical protein